jgi:aconitate hydratase
MTNSFNARTTLKVGNKDYQYFSLKALEGAFKLARLPYSYKICSRTCCGMKTA